MRNRSISWLLGALSLLALPGVARCSAGHTTSRGPSPRLVLGEQDAGPLVSVEGGAMRASVVSSPTGAGGVTRKHLGKLRPDDLVVKVALPPAPPLMEWVASFLRGRNDPRSGAIHEPAPDGTLRSSIHFPDARLVAISLSPLDGQGQTPLELALTLRASSLTRTTGGALPPEVAAARSTPTRSILCSNFRLSLPGLDAIHVLRVGSLSVKVGEDRSLATELLGVEVSEAADPSWRTWAEDFLLRGNAGEAAEKSGELSLLDPTLSQVLMRVELTNVGVAALEWPALPRQEAGGTGLRVELYCEAIGLQAGPAPGTSAPSTAPAASEAAEGSSAPTPTPEAAGAGTEAGGGSEARTDPEDQGARDPTDFPRPPASVRTSFSSSRRHGLEDERAEYRVGEAPGKVEAFLREALVGAGWEETGRDESGDPGRRTYLIDLHYQRPGRLARILLSTAKEATLVRVHLTARPLPEPRQEPGRAPRVRPPRATPRGSTPE